MTIEAEGNTRESMSPTCLVSFRCSVTHHPSLFPRVNQVVISHCARLEQKHHCVLGYFVGSELFAKFSPEVVAALWGKINSAVLRV